MANNADQDQTVKAYTVCSSKAVQIHTWKKVKHPRLEMCQWDTDAPAWCPLYHTMLNL